LKVSIALAAYNGEKYLKKQLESIFSQTHSDIEVVVCDDCSTDKTLKILASYRKEKRLRIFINKKNLGYIKNFERAISLCTGDYIALSDQDDVWMPDKIEILVNNIGNYSLIYSDAELIDGNDRLICDSFMKYQHIDVPEEDEQFKKLLFRNYYTGCTMMFTRSLASKIIPIPETENVHDWWIALCASTENKIKFLNQTLIKYRFHSANVIGAKIFTKRKIIYNLYKDIKNKLLLKSQSLNYLDFSAKLKRIENIISSNIVGKNSQKAFLESLRDYYISYLNNKIHLKTVCLGFKLNKYIYPDNNYISKFFYIINKIL
jgi:glycosyltransferase involved in cell wall biosynthesis